MPLGLYKKAIGLISGYKKALDNIRKPEESNHRYSELHLTLEKMVVILTTFFLYALFPIYFILIFTFVMVYIICFNVYKGILFAIKGIKNGSILIGKGFVFLWRKTKSLALFTGRHICLGSKKFIKAFPTPLKILKRIVGLFFRLLLYVCVPIIFVLLLLIIILSKIFPQLYKWLAYGITGLRIILTVIGQTRGDDYEEFEEAIEFTGFQYDPDQDMFYSEMNPWQKKFGYCRLYDEAASLWGMIVDCEPVYFEYEGKKWLIEFWKGQYDLTTGGEIGIYTTEGPSLEMPGVFNGTFFESVSDQDMMKMSFKLIKSKKTLFIRDEKHWWLTGFKLGEFSRPSELIMEIEIVLKDQFMTDVFIRGLKKTGYSDSEISRMGNTVYFDFVKPKTPQPFTRTRFTDWLIQRKNKYMCRKYQKLTGGYDNMKDKLMIIRQEAPGLYNKLINIGKNIKFYSKYRKINARMK